MQGRKLIVADRFYPSTKTCSGCGAVQSVKLSERVYKCPVCGLNIDRDWNAAINLSRLGAGSSDVKPEQEVGNLAQLLEIRGMSGLNYEKDILKELEENHLKGFVNKLEIGDNSIYVKIAWYSGRIVWIDITIADEDQRRCIKKEETIDGNNLNIRVYEVARCGIENSCKLASKLLQSGTDIGYILEQWRGTYGFPRGICPQLEMVDANGPLNAAAVLIQKNIERWRKNILEGD